MQAVTDELFNAQLEALERGQALTPDLPLADAADLTLAKHLLSLLTTPSPNLLERVQQISVTSKSQRRNSGMMIQSQPKLIVRRLMLVAAAIGLALALLLAASPAARAMVVNALRAIGGIPFNETQQVSPSGAISVDSQYTTLVEVQKSVPFTMQLPTWVPEGYLFDENVILPSAEMGVPHVAFNWLDSEGNYIALSLIQSEVGPFQVGEGSVEEVLVNGKPVALVRGLWDAETGQWIQPERASLMWVGDGIFYTLTAGGEHPISVEELIRVAESLQPFNP